MNEQIIEMGIALTTFATKSAAETIHTKIMTKKQAKNDKETIDFLEEQINELLSERNEIIRIAMSYKEYFDKANLSESDIMYISDSIYSLLESFQNPDQPAVTKSQIDSIKPLINKDTIKIMQLLGFNFREALGEPLTRVVASKIAKYEEGKTKNPHNQSNHKKR